MQPQDTQRQKLLNFLVQNEGSLTTLLSNEAKELFDKFKDAQDEPVHAFVLGFRLGGRFMLEVMEEMKVPFIDA